MKSLIDFTKGWGDIEPRLDSLISQPQGMMSYFPSCCSTGVLKNISASRPGDIQKPVFTGQTPYITALPDLQVLKEGGTIWELVRTVKTNPYFILPFDAGIWNCLSLIYKKLTTGKDDSGDTAYGNYKAPTYVLFDRILEDKDPKKGFKFQYNQIFSVDHFIQWLDDEAKNYGLGEVYISPAKVGAHGARVRGCMFTPDEEALKTFEEERIEILRSTILSNYDFLKDRYDSKANVSKAARMW